MKASKTMILIGFLFLLLLPSSVVIADDDDHDDDYHHGDDDRDDHDESYLKSVNNPTYEAECSGCHFPYQPELLPSASWMKILNQLDDHFGEVVEIDPDSKEIISDYLKSNSAENSSSGLAVKIMRRLGNHVYMRITDIPYIIEEHHELNPEVFERESIGSLSNCIACHTTAERGIYDDDNVKIPR